MCLGCAELARGVNLSRGELTDLKERFHSALSKTSSIGFASSGDAETPKPYDGDNYFERQKDLAEGKTPNRYDPSTIDSYSANNPYPKAA